ncbi:MAG: PKD domain-containing protein [Flavobacteriaceae bacterium]
MDPCKGYTTISVTSSDISGGQAFEVNGQPMYSLEWTYTPENSNEPIRFNGYSIAQAYPGEYHLVINDAMDCSLAQNDSILVRVQEVPSTPFDVQGAFTDNFGEPIKILYNDCVIDPQDVGNIGLIVNGGTPPFEVNWLYRLNALQSFQELPQYADQYLLSNLPKGEYMITVRTAAATSCLPTDVNYEHYYYEERFVLSAGLPQFTSAPVYTADLCQNGIGNLQVEVSDMPVAATFYLNERPIEIVDEEENTYTLRIEMPFTQAALEIRNENNCILASTPLDITVTQPQFTYTSLSADLSSVIPIREEVNFINNTTDNYTHVIWHFGDGESSEQLPRSNLDAHSIFHRYLLAGNYQVRLELFNGRGCSRVATDTITIGEGYHVIFPNAFTPNQDQINDVFRPILSGFSEVNFAVYDQSGTLLYTERKTDSDPPHGMLLDGWNGANAPAEATNFIYTLQGILLDQTTEIQRSGTFIALK